MRELAISAAETAASDASAAYVTNSPQKARENSSINDDEGCTLTLRSCVETEAEVHKILKKIPHSQDFLHVLVE